MKMKKPFLLNTEEFQQYIKDIKKIPVITHKRQDEIFEQLNKVDLDTKVKEKLLSELIVGNLRFVISVAKMYQNMGIDILDLVSEGNIGLIKAADRYNPKSGLKFFSYAVWWIKQSILSSLNEHSRTIRLPSNVIQESQKKKRETRIKPDDTYYIRTDNKSCEDNLPYCVGLNSEINDEGDQLIDIIPNKNADNPEDLLNTPNEIKKKITAILSVLDEREKIIIEKYYGLNGVESNLDDLGEEFGCTKERIRQLRDKSIRKLRDHSYELLKYF